MMNAIWKQWKVWRRDWFLGCVVTVCSSLAGIILMVIMMHFDSEAETYFTAGTMLGGMIAGIYTLIAAALGFFTCFSVEVGFGCTRKYFFISYYLTVLVQSVICIPVLAGICLLEQRLYSIWYPECTNEVELLPWVLGLGGILSLILPLLGMLAALLILRYGRTMKWILWILWMLLFAGIPNLMDAAVNAPDTVYGGNGGLFLKFIRCFSVPQWIGIGAAAVLFCFWITYRMTQKQQVNI